MCNLESEKLSNFILILVLLLAIYTNRKMKNDSESSINCKNRGIHSEEHLENEALLTEPSEINVKLCSVTSNFQKLTKCMIVFGIFI